ncbi:uncharacterized protein LOC129589547 [Paramacrobiotus metropolitanus]|uniref:uncharacterized protein LOC129589547 n=1 Tax=Paramacrobiotus metropolitanus TaxID=2943436 RepID=UPI002445F314|nr:uncharacterized protein LOC129589547 [Paramacrobiotus metropolitanus]
MDALESLWKLITNPSLPESPTTVAEALEKCHPLLFSSFSSQPYLPKREAVAVTADSVQKAVKTPAEVPADLRDNYARQLASVARILYRTPSSVVSLFDNCAADAKESVVTLAAERSVARVLRHYFQKRRLLLNIHRYIYECYENSKISSSHPLANLFEKFVDDVKDASGLINDLIEQCGLILTRLNDHAEKPVFGRDETEWLTLQLGEMRDLSLLLFNLAPILPKTMVSLEKLTKPLQLAGAALQRFPVSPDRRTGLLQMELSQQVLLTLTAFTLHYFSIATPLFLLDPQARHYLDRFFPQNAPVFILGPAAVLYLTTRVQDDPAQQDAVEGLSKLFAEAKPFAALCSLMRAEVMQLELKERLAGLVHDVGEQFIRVFGLKGIQQFAGDFASLAAGILHHPKETNRFWQRWVEGNGADVHYAWGLLVSDLRDRLPGSLLEFITVMGSVFKGFKESGADVAERAGKLNHLLWNLDGFVEQLGDREVKGLTLVKTEAEGVAVVRCDTDRFPLGPGVLVIPANSMGWMLTTDHLVDLKWVLHNKGKYSVWALIAGHILRMSQSTKIAEKYAEMVDDLGKIVKFYVSSLKADGKTHDDLEQVLVMMCRVIGQLMLVGEDVADEKSKHALVKTAFDLCAVEAKFRDLVFVNDLDFIARNLFPKAVRQGASEADWIRNGNFTWFSPFWQELARHSSSKDFMRTLGKLASAMESIVRNVNGGSSSNATTQQANLFLLNIGIPLVVQLEELSEGIPILQYALSIVESLGAVADTEATIRNVAADCLYEGPAGQALVELLNRGGRLLNLFLHNDAPSRVFLSERSDEVHFVHLVLGIFRHLLRRLPERVDTLTALERSLCSLEKHRQVLSVGVPNAYAELYRHPKHGLLQLCRYVYNASDAGIVQLAAAVLTRLLVLQRISLVSVVKQDADDFVQGVFRLLQCPRPEVVRQMWTFVAVCEARQPRMLDVLVNLQYDAGSKKYELDIPHLGSLLDIVISVLKHPACDESQQGALDFCLQLFSSKTDLAEYLYKKREFWGLVMDVLISASSPSLPWEKKLCCVYACDLVAGECLRSQLNSPLFDKQFIEENWTSYINDEIPKILSHLNRDVAQAAAAWPFDSIAMKIVARFFESWCAVNLLCLTQESLRGIVSADTLQNIIRPTFILLNRSLASPAAGLFSAAIVRGLLRMLTQWRRHLTTDLFLSVLHIADDLTQFICSAADGAQWSHAARSSVLHLDSVMLGIIGGLDAEEELDVALKRPLRGLFETALGVVGHWTLRWSVEKDEEEEMGNMLGNAVNLLVAVVKLVGNNSLNGLDEGVQIFQSECLCEKILMKTVEMLKLLKYPLIAQKFLDFFLHLSLHDSGAALLRDIGYLTCIAGPLSSVFAPVRELFVERNTAEMNVEDTVLVREQRQRLPVWLDVYLTGLTVSYNVIHSGRQRHTQTDAFIVPQLGCMPHVINVFRGEPTLAAWRFLELFTRLLGAVVVPGKNSSAKDVCQTHIPSLYHLVCHQLMKFADVLTADATLLSGRLIQLMLNCGLSCLKIMGVDQPGLYEMLTDQKFLLPSSSVRSIVDYSFGSPISLELAPTLSFGTLVHIIRTGVEILQKVDPAPLASVVFARESASTSADFLPLLHFVQRTAVLLLQQASVFVVGFGQLSDESWQETLRELNNEIMDLQQSLHAFLNKLEDNLETSSLREPSGPTTLLPLISQLFLNFRLYYDETRDSYGEPSSLASLPRGGDRKKSPFTWRKCFLIGCDCVFCFGTFF